MKELHRESSVATERQAPSAARVPLTLATSTLLFPTRQTATFWITDGFESKRGATSFTHNFLSAFGGADLSTENTLFKPKVVFEFSKNRHEWCQSESHQPTEPGSITSNAMLDLRQSF